MKLKPLIEIKDVSIGYASEGFLKSINLSIERGDFWGIMGPNGGGKSTLIKTILGLIPKVSGRIDYWDNTVFGYVPQTEIFDRIFPISVYEIVMMGRYGRIPVGRRPGQTDRKIAEDSLAKLEISHLKNRPFRSLSGGEKQRALLARAIAATPDVLVLDEPTASVDIRGETEIMGHVARVREENKLTVLMVSHFLNTVSRFADHVMLIDKDNGIFKAGIKDDVLSDEILSKIFGIDITLDPLHDRLWQLI
ncbi:MAG: metal ABC transporter ATP-binding protein [Thermodesulfobacteriota bacterium]